jgi:hypothetical protein
MPRLKSRDQQPLLHTVEEATELLRRVSLEAWVWWFAGTAPLVCAMLHFISDMSRAAAARDRLAAGALVVALAYWAMKVAHAFFADHLLRHLRHDGAVQPLNWRGRLRLVTSQAIIHATAPWILMLAGTAMLPLGWAYAFYHNVSVLTLPTLRSGGRVRDIVRSALAQSHYRQGQNHGLMLVLLVVAMLVWLNLLAGAYLCARLAHSITGAENFISLNPHVLLSSGSMAATIGLAYLIVGPLVKAMYAVRCFYSLSRRNGEDIAVQFRQSGATTAAFAALAVLFLSTAPPCWAINSAAAERTAQSAAPAAPAIDPSILHTHIREVLQQDAFQWRLPRGSSEAGEDKTWLDDVLHDFNHWFSAVKRDMKAWFDDRLGKWIKEALRKMFGGDESKAERPSNSMWTDTLPALLWGLLGVLTFILCWLIIRQWRQMPPAAVVATATETPELNLENDSLVASQLPENEWLRLAQEKMDAGEYRLAMRALFLATLAHLGEEKLIAIARSKSNGDYVRELGYRARERENLRARFLDSVRAFDRAWYGWHEVTRDLLEHFRDNHHHIVSDGSPRLTA